MNRKIHYAITVIVITTLLATFFAYNSVAGESRITKISLRLAWLPGSTFTGDYVAVHNGYWKKLGLDTILNPGGFEYDAIKFVAAGVDTFGITSGPQLLQARANGVPVVAIGAVIPRSPIGWVSKKTSGISRPQDFVGKKIGAQFGTHTEITLEALCAKLGIPLNSFTRIAVKFDPRPFVAGVVDVLPVYIIDQPIDLERKDIKLNIIDPGDYGVSLAYGNLYFTTEDTIRSKPELVRKFLEGAKKGWIWAYDHQRQAINILASAIPDADKKALFEKLKATFNFIMKGRQAYLGVFSMSIADWENTHNILIQYGELPKGVDISRIFTNTFIQ